MPRLFLIVLLAVFVRPIKAETWLSRPLTMVVPFATGGPMDAVARILQPGDDGRVRTAERGTGNRFFGNATTDAKYRAGPPRGQSV